MANKNPNTSNLKPFQPGQSGNPNGHKVGQKNRGTITRKIFEMRGVLPKEIYAKMKLIYPEIEQTMSIEELIDIVQAHKAIGDKDTQAAKYLKDNVYGAPKGEVDLNTNTTISIKIE